MLLGRNKRDASHRKEGQLHLWKCPCGALGMAWFQFRGCLLICENSRMRPPSFTNTSRRLFRDSQDNTPTKHLLLQLDHPRCHITLVIGVFVAKNGAGATKWAVLLLPSPPASPPTHLADHCPKNLSHTLLVSRCTGEGDFLLAQPVQMISPDLLSFVFWVREFRARLIARVSYHCPDVVSSTM